jgi:hypothetical protein
MLKERHPALPDATDAVGGGIGIVVRVAIVEVRVPRIRATVLSSGPEVVGRGKLPAADLDYTTFHPR